MGGEAGSVWREDIGSSGRGLGAAANSGHVRVNHKTKAERMLFCSVLHSAGEKTFHLFWFALLL